MIYLKRVAIVQSNYIPWKGYFDLIASVDEFILFDEMQFTRRDWRNRNKIKTAHGTKWLTVPVTSRGKYTQTIAKTEISDKNWANQHWKTLEYTYRGAPHFDEVSEWLRPLYIDRAHRNLSQMNQLFLEMICARLGITTPITRCEDYTLVSGKSERLASLTQQAGGKIYVSGPAARGYLDAEPFSAQNIEIEWFSYDNYAEYPQLFPPFEHGVTILDLLFTCGKTSPDYMKFGLK